MSEFRDLRSLPKAHLHLHLEGAMRPATLRELAEEHDVALPALPDPSRPGGYGSFTTFLDAYVAACEVLRRPEDLRRLIDEVVDDARSAGAVYAQPQFCPLDHEDRLGPPEAVVELAIDAVRQASARTGVAADLMISADRTRPPADALRLARVAAHHAGQGVVAFGLASDEAAAPPAPFTEAFRLARAAGLVSAPHAGEHGGPDNVRAALDELGATRIAHGVRAVRDPALVRRLAEEQVCLDVCPTSNVVLSVVPSLAEHPLPALLAAGVPCSLNADDPLLFGSGLLEEYERCRSGLGLSDRKLAEMARASLTFSGAPPAVLEQGRAGVDRWLAAAMDEPR